MTRDTSSFFEVRFHGRGGQGAVSAAAVLALAAFESGFQAQAFPKFGSERRGAPVEAYVRISDKIIRTHTQIYTPDVLIVQDASLLQAVAVLDGLKAKGTVIFNGEQPSNIQSQADAKEKKDKANGMHRWICLPATQIAQTRIGRPLPNMVLLGAFAAISNYVNLDSLKAAIENHLSNKGEKIVSANLLALEDGFQFAKQQL